MSRLSWEYGDKDDQIVIRKPKGKLTVQEIREFMNERKQLMDFGEGALCVIAWRSSGESYIGWELFGEPQGDTVDLFVLQDSSTCFCGKVLYPQYCPACGHKLTEEAS
ncbi:MAG: hypothetical protein IKP40_08890 [Clostridia bacterium]|nr:hypothetical protein [Clostridia bacterium]